jgi:hypothetical protein
LVVGATAAIATGLFLPIRSSAVDVDDYPITIAGVAGHYWTQTGGYGMVGALLDAYESAGGAAVWGPPVSREYRDSVGRIN